MDYEHETEIDLKALLFFILYKWRVILLAAAAAGILLAGCKFFCNTMEASGDSGKSKELREYELALAEYELTQTAYERDMADYQARLAQQNAYMEKSVLMQIDPYAKPSAAAEIFVKLDASEWADLPDNVNMDPTDSLIAVYTSNLLSYIDWETIEQITGKEAIYLKELLWIEADYNSNTFTVGIVYNDGGIAQQILDVIVNQITAKCQDMGTDVNKHTISVVNRTLTYNIDNSLADAQKAGADAIAGYEQAIISCRQALENLEAEEPRPPHSIKKFFVLGFAAGALLAVLFIGAAYILGGRLREENELSDKYGIRLLGIFFHPQKKRFLPFIDRILYQWEGRGEHIHSDDTYRHIAISIMSFAGKSDMLSGRKLLATGTVDIKKIQEFTNAVAPNLEGITLTAAANISRCPDTLKDIAGYDGIILVEEKHVSLTEEIKKEQAYFSALNKPVIGYVLI